MIIRHRTFIVARGPRDEHQTSALRRAARPHLMNDVTQILSEIESGESAAPARLLELVYHELRRLAAQKMAQERSGQTLQPTALVHEAYLRLVDVDAQHHWTGRAHFFGAAAEAMRRILVEHARRKASLKRGGAHRRVELNSEVPQPNPSTVDVIAVSDALEQLQQTDPRKADVVKLRYFAGLDLAQTATALGLSEATVKRDWTYARAWLYRKLSEEL